MFHSALQCSTVMESQCSTVDQTECRTDTQEVCDTVTDMTCLASESCTTHTTQDCTTAWNVKCRDPRQASIASQVVEGRIEDVMTVGRVLSVTRFSDGSSRDPTKSSSIIDR